MNAPHNELDPGSAALTGYLRRMSDLTPKKVPGIKADASTPGFSNRAAYGRHAMTLLAAVRAGKPSGLAPGLNRHDLLVHRLGSSILPTCAVENRLTTRL